MTTLDDIRTASPERLSEIAAREIMGYTRATRGNDPWMCDGDNVHFSPHEDRNDLYLVLEKVPEEKRIAVADAVEHLTIGNRTPDEAMWDAYARVLFAPPEVILRAALEILCG